MRRIDDLGINELKLIQDTDMFCFGIDAVMLANFVYCKVGARIVDLCTGNGIIPVLLSAKVPAQEIIGVEIQEKVAKLADENVKLNNLQEKLKIINVVITSENLQLIKSLLKIFMTSILNKLFINIFCERNNILFICDILVKTLMEIITYKIKI